MDQVIQVEWSSASVEEARRICRALVERRIVACAQIIPGMESIYLWKGNVETAFEVKVYLKTIERLFPQVEQVILENCSYELPEILKVEVGGLESYLNWVRESLV